MPQSPQTAAPAPPQPPLPYGAKILPSTPDTPETVYTPTPTHTEEALAGVGRALKGMTVDTLKAIFQPDNPLGIVGDIGKQIVQMLDAGVRSAESGEGRAGQTLSMMENAPLIGGMVRKAEEAGPGKFKFGPATTGAVSEGITYAAAPWLAGKGIGAVKGWVEGRPIDTPQAAKTITDAVNPSPRQIRPFQDTLTTHMPEVIEYARDKGINLTDPQMARENLAKALQGTSGQLRSQYYEKYINPTRDTLVPTQNIPGYKGATVDYNTATIGQLDARLTEINATLNPAYERGGQAARIAVSAESKALLNAEAAVIRNRINSTVGSKLGIDPGQVAGARSKFGQLSTASDRILRAADRDRFAANQAKGGVVTDKAGLKRMAGQYVKEAISNPDKKVADAFRKMYPESDVEMERRRPTGADPKKAALDALERQIKNLEAGRASGSGWSPKRLQALEAAKAKLQAIQPEHPTTPVEGTSPEEIQAGERRLQERRKSVSESKAAEASEAQAKEQRLTERREAHSWTKTDLHTKAMQQAMQEMGGWKPGTAARAQEIFEQWEREGRK